jgi:LPXTG-site transpeptidase (sortase) family protein
MKTYDDDVTQFATTMLSNRRSRRNLLRAGAAALAAAAVGSFDALAAPLEQATTPEPDPWESGACDDAAQSAAAAGTPTVGDDDFLRPTHILIPGIKVDAKVEVLEIVDGALQDPSNGNDVAWYKETSHPGKKGNAVFAGHLNWYDMPEGVFFAIDQLKEGDEIFVRDQTCGQFRYVVEYAELVQVKDADMTKITGQSDDSMLTLITCGGTWDPSISEYRERTVVRALLDGTVASDQPQEQPQGDDDVGQPIIEPKNGG